MTLRYAKKVDANQPAVVKRLRELGVSVQPIHTLGKGVPDLLLGVAGWNFLIELKVDAKSRLTTDEDDWHRDWEGQVDIAITVSQILQLILERLGLINDHRVRQEHYRLSRALEHQLEMESIRHALDKPDRGRRAKGRRQVNRLPAPGRPPQ